MSNPSIPERFQILEELCRSATEVRLRARDTILEREVVLEHAGPGVQKLMAAARDRTRALREARMLARIQHPNVCRLLDVLETASGPLLVLEPVAGETLGSLLERDGKLPAAEVRRLGQLLSDAAQAVHAVGVVHRGIDEASILMAPDGTPVLTGFAFAKPSGGLAMSSIDYRSKSSTITTAPALPSHPAPEQLAGQAADARADVFGLGCVLYRCLSGSPAFPTGGGVACFWEDPAPLAKAAPDVPKNLVAAIHKCLARSPIARFQTMRDLGDALAEDAVPSGGVSSFPRRRALLSTAAVAVLGVGVWSLSGSSDAGDGSRHLGARGRPADDPAPVATGGMVFAPHYDESRALLIGIDYRTNDDFPVLDNAERDVLEIERALLELGWKQGNIRSVRGSDATKTRIETELADLSKEAGQDDQVFVYFAGHGVESGEQLGHAIPADAKQKGVRLPVVSYVSFDTFDAVFRACPAKHILVALDCCHSGASFRGIAREAGLRDGFESYLRERARVLMTSSRSDEAANDGATGHSPFAAGFLEMLEKAKSDTVLTAAIHVKVGEKLARFPRQRPLRRIHDSAPDGSDFLFFRRN